MMWVELVRRAKDASPDSVIYCVRATRIGSWLHEHQSFRAVGTDYGWLAQDSRAGTYILDRSHCGVRKVDRGGEGVKQCQ